MPKYRLTRAADDDITDIYTYTYREFGVAQADTYLESLEAALIRAGNNPELGIRVDHLRPGYRRLVHQEHTIFYKAERGGILVVRVLGPGMSVGRYLPG